MKKYEVLLTEAALGDLEDLHRNLIDRGFPEKAEALLQELVQTTEKLTTFPDRGACPPELAWLGVREFRQVHFLTYRVVYQRVGLQVFILFLADSRQDLQRLLERRLLDA